MSATYLKVVAPPRYWEDTKVNGQKDVDGTLIPFREGDNWCPIIELSNGRVLNWPEITARIYYKVCDEGSYYLLDDNKDLIGKWAGFYVPDDFLCHGGNGYGDYIILSIDKFGMIKDWKLPQIGWDDWIKLSGFSTEEQP